MNTRKARGPIAVAALAAFGLIAAGCTAAPDEPKGESSFTYRLSSQHSIWLNDLKWFPEIEDATGTKVTVADGGPGDTYYQKLDLSMTSGNLEDAVLARAAQVNVYGSQGAFLDLAPLIESDAPNIKAYLEKNDDFRDLVTNEDGTIYGLLFEGPIMTNVTFYRSDQYEKAGIEPSDTLTPDEFTDQLQTLKDTYGAADPDYYPFSGRDSFLKYQFAFDAADGVSNGKVHGLYAGGGGSDIHSDGFLEMVEWYKDLADKGLIDPEWVNGTATEDTWQQKMLTGKASVTDDFYSRPSYFMANGGPTNDPDYGMAVLPALSDQAGEQKKRFAQIYTLDRDFAINAKAKNPKAIIKFLDYLYSPEGQETMHYGVEGESYKLDGDTPEYTVDYSTESNQEAGTKVWDFQQNRPTFPAPIDNEAYYKWSDPLTASYATDYFTKYADVQPTLKYTTEQLAERATLQATVEPFVLSQVTAFVQGKRPLSEWNTFLDEADAQGYTDITAIDQAALDASS